ncbi:hypothetical protein K488DRAFT_82028 [Vararia minispora EC-137]|uniref:Uncharacterized protein n=1 Tax=Vararia minispora EC-137 TaxID=1314806 RepID=A0ACB8QX51_9AGAM|nr:hypothetical protein K488DRAFT_82028 [Vararia minispora EC-137]
MTEYTSDSEAVANYFATQRRVADWAMEVSTAASASASSSSSPLTPAAPEPLPSRSPSAASGSSSHSLPPRMLLRYPDGHDIAIGPTEAERERAEARRRGPDVRRRRRWHADSDAAEGPLSPDEGQGQDISGVESPYDDNDVSRRPIVVHLPVSAPSVQPVWDADGAQPILIYPPATTLSAQNNSDSRAPALFVYLTPFRLLTSALIAGLGIPKAVVSYQGASAPATTLDWVSAVGVGLVCVLPFLFVCARPLMVEQAHADYSTATGANHSTLLRITSILFRPPSEPRPRFPGCKGNPPPTRTKAHRSGKEAAAGLLRGGNAWSEGSTGHTQRRLHVTAAPAAKTCFGDHPVVRSHSL